VFGQPQENIKILPILQNGISPQLVAIFCLGAEYFQNIFRDPVNFRIPEKSKKYGEIGQLVIITISEYCNINIVAAKQGLNLEGLQFTLEFKIVSEYTL